MSLGLITRRPEYGNDEFCFRNFVMQCDAELIEGCKNDLMQACIAMLIIASQNRNCLFHKMRSSILKKPKNPLTKQR